MAIPTMEPISHLQDQDSPNDESNAYHDLRMATWPACDEFVASWRLHWKILKDESIWIEHLVISGDIWGIGMHLVSIPMQMDGVYSSLHLYISTFH